MCESEKKKKTEGRLQKGDRKLKKKKLITQKDKKAVFIYLFFSGERSKRQNSKKKRTNKKIGKSKSERIGRNDQNNKDETKNNK